MDTITELQKRIVQLEIMNKDLKKEIEDLEYETSVEINELTAQLDELTEK